MNLCTRNQLIALIRDSDIVSVMEEDGSFTRISPYEALMEVNSFGIEVFIPAKSHVLEPDNIRVTIYERAALVSLLPNPGGIH